MYRRFRLRSSGVMLTGDCYTNASSEIAMSIILIKNKVESIYKLVVVKTMSSKGGG